MMDVKTTLKNLHKNFPALSLDDLLRILDCYVEEYISTPYISFKDYPIYDTQVTCTYGNNETLNGRINRDIKSGD